MVEVGSKKGHGGYSPEMRVDLHCFREYSFLLQTLEIDDVSDMNDVVETEWELQ